MGWRYKLGLGLIGTFVFIWVASAEVTQRIFTSYKQPFAITYLGVSLMAIYLPVAIVRDWICSLCWRNLFRNFSHYYRGTNDVSELVIPLRSNEDGLSDEESHSLISKSEENEPSFHVQSTELDSWGIAKCSLFVAPIWFLTEYMSNSALANTSVASTTVLTSTSGLFTLFFGSLLGQESIRIAKVVAVFISMVGVAMTTIGKTWAPDELLSASETRRHCITGDIFGLLSAASYGLFTVLLKKSAGSKGDKVDVQKFFGYIGLFTLLGLWWLALPLYSLGMEPKFTFPNSRSLTEAVLVNGFIGSFLSDYIWALSVVWTTPLVATLGMSLTIPLAMVADMVVHGRNYSAIYIIGCVQVFVGFVIANISDKFTAKLELL
ncbi:hypothetical protein SAY87_014961 [Trapa incisa]|uniref:EamA domain-containing protein n=1 Tax=Trapa incisa TaxID=236973 RepID=A0AAN7JLK8_9MYRT|nr:hypothetical protein SAY87_014961 [Trapa incisa]